MTKQQSNYIKIIAMTAMLIDHIGVIIFPQYTIFRIIGRIAFPLFAYQIGIGFSNTRSAKRYLLRLFLFGAAVQLFYGIAAPFIDENPLNLNIFFTLSLGVAAILCYEKKRYALLLCIIVFPMAAALVNVTFDYGSYGVLLILGMYATRDSFRKMALYTVLLTVAVCFVWDYFTQLYCVAALLFIAKPLALKARIHSSVFYIFYPLHLAVLYLINALGYF